MTDIARTLASVVDLTEKLASYAIDTKDTAARELINDLRLALSDVKEKLADLINENTQLKDEVGRANATTPYLEIHDGLYYSANGDGPYCTACADSKSKTIRVTQRSGQAARLLGRYTCPVCKANYEGIS